MTASHAVASAKDVAKPVRVFVLAGQSNMEGAGLIKADPKRNGGQGSLEFLVKDAATAKRFAPLVDSAGQWRTRDDVWISYLDRNGPLTIGYGARSEVECFLRAALRHSDDTAATVWRSIRIGTPIIWPL